MEYSEVSRKELDNQEFLKLRQVTERVNEVLTKRLRNHLDVLQSLFFPRKLLGTHIKSSFTGEVAGSDKVFTMLQERYGAICEEPFKLPKKLESPLHPMSNQLEATPFQYSLYCEGSEDKAIKVTSPTSWILSYRSECPVSRLKGMLSGIEAPQRDDIKRSLLDHIVLVIFLERLPALRELLKDLRYQIEIKELSDLGRLPVVVLRAPLRTFLPADAFILQITQLSGVPAFQEIVDLGDLTNLPDPFRESLAELAG